MQNLRISCKINSFRKHYTNVCQTLIGESWEIFSGKLLFLAVVCKFFLRHCPFLQVNIFKDSTLFRLTKIFQALFSRKWYRMYCVSAENFLGWSLILFKVKQNFSNTQMPNICIYSPIWNKRIRLAIFLVQERQVFGRCTSATKT